MTQVQLPQLGKYRLLEVIAKGGMGEVYRAFDTSQDRVVALKLLPAHLSEDERFRQRFRRESQAAAGLNDPHVVPIHDFGEIDGRLYIDTLTGDVRRQALRELRRVSPAPQAR